MAPYSWSSFVRVFQSECFMMKRRENELPVTKRPNDGLWCQLKAAHPISLIKSLYPLLGS